MSNRLKILLPILALLLAGQFFFSHLEKKAYDKYADSNHCRIFPSIVMEVGLKKAI